VSDLYPDHVIVHPVPCELDTCSGHLAAWQARNPGMAGPPPEYPGSPCLIEDKMCVTCGAVDPADYDPAVHGPDQSLAARRGRIQVRVTEPGPR
jgi:hypothetical protein